MRGKGLQLKIRNKNITSGLRATKLLVNGDIIRKSKKINHDDIKTVSMTVTALFPDVYSENKIKDMALKGKIEKCKIEFENGDQLTGRFKADQLDYLGISDNKRNYVIHMESVDID